MWTLWLSGLSDWHIDPVKQTNKKIILISAAIFFCLLVCIRLIKSITTYNFICLTGHFKHNYPYLIKRLSKTSTKILVANDNNGFILFNIRKSSFHNGYVNQTHFKGNKMILKSLLNFKSCQRSRNKFLKQYPQFYVQFKILNDSYLFMQIVALLCIYILDLIYI